MEIRARLTIAEAAIVLGTIPLLVSASPQGNTAGPLNLAPAASLTAGFTYLNPINAGIFPYATLGMGGNGTGTDAIIPVSVTTPVGTLAYGPITVTPTSSNYPPCALFSAIPGTGAATGGAVNYNGTTGTAAPPSDTPSTFAVDISYDCLNQLKATGIYTATLSVASNASNGPVSLPLQLVVSAAFFSVPIWAVYEALNSFQEIGIFRPASPAFFVLDQNGTYNYAPNDTIASFGLPGDIPVAGIWASSISIGVFRCPAGSAVCQWYIDLNNNGTWDGVEGGDAIWNFGLPGDIPVVGDWTGDGGSKIGVFRCPAPQATGVCYWVLDAGGKGYYDPTTARIATFGLPGDKPVPSNWGGGPVYQVGVFRGNGLWIVDNLSFGTWSPNDATYSYGLAGDYPVVGNWYGNLPAVVSLRIGVFRPGTGQWILNQSGSNSWLPTDPVGNFGLPGDLPVIGLWTIQP